MSSHLDIKPFRTAQSTERATSLSYSGRCGIFITLGESCTFHEELDRALLVSRAAVPRRCRFPE